MWFLIDEPHFQHAILPYSSTTQATVISIARKLIEHSSRNDPVLQLSQLSEQQIGLFLFQRFFSDSLPTSLSYLFFHFVSLETLILLFVSTYLHHQSVLNQYLVIARATTLIRQNCMPKMWFTF